MISSLLLKSKDFLQTIHRFILPIHQPFMLFTFLLIQLRFCIPELNKLANTLHLLYPKPTRLPIAYMEPTDLSMPAPKPKEAGEKDQTEQISSTINCYSRLDNSDQLSHKGHIEKLDKILKTVSKGRDKLTR